MKTLTTILLSLLIPGFLLGEDNPKNKKLVIGKIIPNQEQVAEKLPNVNPDKPKKPFRKPFPAHWGKPPDIQTRDLKPLPGGFGMGSSTLAHWIGENIKKDKTGLTKPNRPKPSKEVQEKLNAMRLIQNELGVARKSLMEELKGKSKEEIRELIQSFKDAQKEKHEELKLAKKELAQEVRDKIQTRDRRE
ncbi:hypothetical protein CMO96_03780 [Candidatus Woesebacteria bacterium]|nr:hypothetical protein [Candidatus Woesebacteria bacterium]